MGSVQRGGAQTHPGEEGEEGEELRTRAGKSGFQAAEVGILGRRVPSQLLPLHPAQQPKQGPGRRACSRDTWMMTGRCISSQALLGFLCMKIYPLAQESACDPGKEKRRELRILCRKRIPNPETLAAGR